MDLYQLIDATQEPVLKTHDWIQEAKEQGVGLPHAMNLASVDREGRPSSRIVLLKRLSDEGFVFFTDYESNKGKQILDFPYAALTFWWAKTNKQIRIQGQCYKVSEKENDKYFASRPKGSQISASVSLQSKEIPFYENLVKEFFVFEEDHSNKKINRPKRWGGFIVKPVSVEFWKDQKNRLHKRKLYQLKDNLWKTSLLSP